MNFEGPFQPKLFCFSMVLPQLNCLQAGPLSQMQTTATQTVVSLQALHQLFLGC